MASEIESVQQGSTENTNSSVHRYQYNCLDGTLALRKEVRLNVLNDHL